jgi:hypothetical protein
MKNFDILEVPHDLMKDLIFYIESEKWVSTGDEDIREIPQWLSPSYIPDPTDIQFESYDNDAYFWCPEKYVLWAISLLKVYGQRYLSLSVEMWNGSGDDNWHIDDDGGDYVNKIFIAYYTPQALNQFDGGAFEYMDGDQIKSVTPTTGTCVGFYCVDNLHRATKMQSDKPRYTVLIRCLTDIPKKDYNSRSQNHRI